MKKGMIFDLYREGVPTIRVCAINEKDVIYLKTGEVIYDIDFENEVSELLIEDIFNL